MMFRLLTIFVVVSLAPTAALTQDIIVPPAVHTITLGKGYDSLTRRTKDNCIKYTNPGRRINTTSKDAEVQYSINEISERSRLAQLLSLDASASVSYGAISGGGRYSYYQSAEFNSFDYYAYIHVVVRKEVEQIDTFEYTEEAKAA
jgi:hypothetical protein